MIKSRPACEFSYHLSLLLIRAFKSLIAVNKMSSYTLFLAAACYIGTAAAGPPANDAVFPSTLSDCGEEYSEFEQAGILQESD
jgi:hypothetical protein